MATGSELRAHTANFPVAWAVLGAMTAAALFFLLPLLAPPALNGSVTEILLGTVVGLAVGAALRVDRRVLPAIAVGATLGTFARFADGQQEAPVSLGIALVVGAEVWAMTFLLRRSGAFRLVDPGDLISFGLIVLAVTVPSGLAVAGLAELDPTPRDDFLHVWRAWVIDDLFGLMCIAPAVITLRRPTSWDWRRAVEWSIAVAYTAVSVWYVFIVVVPGQQGLLGWPYFIVIGSLWIAVRQGTRAVAPIVAISFWVAIVATVTGLGAFAVAAPDPLDRLLAVQMFCITMATVIFALSTLGDSRRAGVSRLATSELLLRQVVDGTDALVYAKSYAPDAVKPGEVVLVNAAAGAFVGRPAAEILGRTNEELFPADLARAFTEEDLQVLRSGEPLESQREVTLPDGSVEIFQGSTVPLADATGRVWGIAGFSTDVTELVAAREQARRQADLLHAVFELSPTPAVRMSLRPGTGLAVTAANAAMCRLVGAPEGDLDDCDLMEHVHPDDAQTVLELVTHAASAGDRAVALDVRQRELRILADDGRTVWVLMSAAALQAVADEVEVVAQFEDFTARRAAEEALTDQAMRDTVTGLPNRRALHERMQAALQRMRRHGGQVTVLFCDLDHFKDINDSLGHHVGDRLLVEVANRLKAALRPEDTIARIGGDEFVAFGEGFADTADAVLMAVRLQDRLSTPWMLEEQVFRPAMSIGIATTGDPETSADELLRRADLAMYRAKERGRNRIELYDRAVDEEVQHAVSIQHQLRRSIDMDVLRLHYQPIVNLSDGRVLGVEALVRMPGQDGTLLTPAEFIPQAEASGLVVPMGAWVVGQALTDLAMWREAGRELTMSVNVSPSQLRDEGFATYLLEEAARHGIRPEWISIEVTETALIHDPARSRAELTALNQAGVRVSLDDFGTGYSSLSWLTQFPVNVVKIDKSFTDDVGVDERKTAIVSAVISVSHELGFTVVAEGIESEDQRRRLLALGCDNGQGYLFGHPVPVEEALWT